MAEYSRARPTQQDRAAETRERILKAAVECLVERGYAGTTTTEVAKRAGVSRGAQMYHFATRSSLVLTTVEYLFERRNEEFRRAVQALPERDRYPAAIDQLWHLRNSETFYAWLEVQVAARTDAELRESLRPLNKRMSAAIHQNFEELFPELAAVPHFAVIPDFVLGLMGGLALDQIAGCEEERVARVIETLKLIGGLLDQFRSLDLGGLLPGVET